MGDPRKQEEEGEGGRRKQGEGEEELQTRHPSHPSHLAFPWEKLRRQRSRPREGPR